MVIEMNSIIINVILIIFPILMYLVISCYNLLTTRNVERVIFIITVCTSLYLSLTYNINNEKELLLFCNIPILICYFKKEYGMGLILSLMVIIVSYFEYDFNLYVLIVKYILYFITYILLFRRKDFRYLFLKITAIIQGFFITFEYFIISNNEIDKIFYLILDTLFIYIITFVCLYLFKLADNITLLYSNMNKVQEENKLKNSLFKLTHEIKNPLAVCKGYMDMINLNNVDKANKYIKIVKSEIDRSLDVMNDFMEYSKIKVNKEIFDLNILFGEIYDSFDLLLKGRGIKFKYVNDYDELYLWGDYNRLKQVFVNVIKNSVEAIQDNGIIEMIVSVNKNGVKIIIQDNGIGMSESELEHVYEMFYTSKKNGTGLGVSLSYEIILRHNGSMKYQSVKNEGTKCIIELPR